MILDDELEVLLLLNYLPDSWGNLVISLSNLTPNGQLTLDMVKDVTSLMLLMAMHSFRRVKTNREEPGAVTSVLTSIEIDPEQNHNQGKINNVIIIRDLNI